MRKTEHTLVPVEELTPDIAQVHSLGEGKGEVAIALHNGKVYAFGSLCPHQNASLQNAPIEKDCVVCKRHGYRFSLKTGDCRTIGGYGIPTYEVVVRDGLIVILCWEWDEN